MPCSPRISCTTHLGRGRSRRHPLSAIAATLSFALASCSGGGVDPERECVVSSVVVSPGTATVPSGATQQLNAAVSSSDCQTAPAAQWTSSVPTVASVSSNGLVTGVATGSATITATALGKTGTASIAVTPPPIATLTLPATATITTGGTTTPTLIARDAQGNILSGRAVSWVSLAPAVASVSQAGVITGVGVGTTTVTASAEGRNASIAVTVTLVPVNSVVVTPTNPSVVQGGNLQLTATLRDVNNNVLAGRAVSWASGLVSRATVSQTGIVTALTVGSVTISATSEGRGSSTTVTVTAVPQVVASVTVSPATTTLMLGSTTTVTATARTSGGTVVTGRTVTWTSVSPTIASVNASSGLITALAPGAATIRATVDGVVGTMIANVTLTNENQRFAYAWVDQATANFGAPYTPSTSWSTNATGGTVTATRTGTGVYDVVFGKMAKAGNGHFRENVFVTSYGVSGETCAVNTWNDVGIDLRAQVTCFAIGSGAPTNSQFNILVIGSGALPTANAFFYHWSGTGNAQASSPFSYSSQVLSQFGTRNSIGRYSVEMGLINPGTTVAFVSPMVSQSLSSSTSCHAENWVNAAATVNVYCTLANAPVLVNAIFTVLQVTGGRAGTRWGFAFNDVAANPIGAGYLPSPSNQRQSNGGQITITRTGTGDYEVRFSNLARTLPSQRETFMVGAWGAAAQTCQVMDWLEAGGHVTAYIRCRNLATGAQENASFAILMIE